MRFIPSALLAIASLLASAQAPEPYRDASLSAHERAADLLPRLTLDEKISLMMDVSPAIERLGIPEYNWWNEALHGVGRAGLATVFPQSIGMAATFDNDAVLAAFNAVSDEARAKYNGFPSHTVTVLEGVRDITGRDIPYLRGCDHVINNNFVSCFNLLSSDGRPGITATYWNNKSRDGQSVAVERLTVPVNKSTGGATVFAPGVNLTDFSARYVGTFKPEESGRYTMQLRTDNGFRRLSVDGTTLVDNSTKGNRNTYTCTFNAEKGKSYDIELLYGAGDRTALLSFDIGMIKDYDTDAGDADVVIFVGGIAPSLEGEEMPVSVPGFRGGDRESIELPAMQRNLLKNLKAQGKKIVYVNCSGSAVALAPEDSICDAILQAWYPGQAGGTAVAEVLYGDYNPAGRLPVTFYRDDSQLPDFLDYSMDGRTYRYMKDKPLYAFGHGLSYTTFDYESASLDRKSAKCGDNVNLNIKLRNAGKRDGDEVVQVYIRKEGDFGGPVKTLRAFKRVTLPAGTSRDIAFTLTPDAFKTYDQKSGRMAVTPGKYEILYGGSSENLKSLPLTLK